MERYLRRTVGTKLTMAGRRPDSLYHASMLPCYRVLLEVRICWVSGGTIREPKGQLMAAFPASARVVERPSVEH